MVIPTDVYHVLMFNCGENGPVNSMHKAIHMATCIAESRFYFAQSDEPGQCSQDFSRPLLPLQHRKCQGGSLCKIALSCQPKTYMYKSKCSMVPCCFSDPSCARREQTSLWYVN